MRWYWAHFGFACVNCGYDVHVVDLPESIEAHPTDVPSITANATSAADLARATNTLT